MKISQKSRVNPLFCSAICIALLSPLVYAEKKLDANWGMDLRVQREHQSFNDTDADLNTLSVQPYVQVGNWDISMTLPWQKIDGEYFINGFQPTPSRICERLGSLNTLERQVLLNRGSVTGDQLDYCGSQGEESAVVDDSVSGISDVSLFARYATPLDPKGVWLGSVGLGYKLDNGDVDTGLGSGTRDTTMDLSLSAQSGKWTGYLAAGYVWISGGVAYTEPGDTEGEVINHGYDNYAYASLDGGYKLTNWMTLGASANTQQAYVPGGDDVKWLTAYANFRFNQKLRLRAYLNDYLDIAGYPEQEFGASLSYSF